MRIMQRAYMKDFLKLLFLLALGLSIVFSLLDLIDKIGSFMPGRPTAIHLVLYAFFNVPKFFMYLLPMSVLICSLFTFSQASRRGEITAIKTAGGRVRSLFVPFVAAGALISAVAFITAEVIAPDFSGRAMLLRNYLEGKTKRFASGDGGFWLKAKDGSPVKIDLYVPEQKLAKGVTIFITGPDFLKEEIIADYAAWNGSSWVLSAVKRYDVATGKMSFLKTMNYADIESPDLFGEELKGTDEMGIAELYRYMQRLKKAGFRNTKLAVSLNSKMSFPLINFFMMLLGLSLSATIRIGGGIFSAGIGLFISLLYWLGYTVTLSLGFAGILPPAVSAWTVPVVFSSLATYLYANIPE